MHISIKKYVLGIPKNMAVVLARCCNRSGLEDPLSCSYFSFFMTIVKYYLHLCVCVLCKSYLLVSLQWPIEIWCLPLESLSSIEIWVHGRTRWVLLGFLMSHQCKSWREVRNKPWQLMIWHDLSSSSSGKPGYVKKRAWLDRDRVKRFRLTYSWGK